MDLEMLKIQNLLQVKFLNSIVVHNMLAILLVFSMRPSG